MKHHGYEMALIFAERANNHEHKKITRHQEVDSNQNKTKLAGISLAI